MANTHLLPAATRRGRPSGVESLRWHASRLQKEAHPGPSVVRHLAMPLLRYQHQYRGDWFAQDAVQQSLAVIKKNTKSTCTDVGDRAHVPCSQHARMQALFQKKSESGPRSLRQQTATRVHTRETQSKRKKRHMSTHRRHL